jgi:hypothetical protein
MFGHGIGIDILTVSLLSSLMASRYVPLLSPLSLSQLSSSLHPPFQTYINFSPQRGLVGPIISRFENRGFKLAAIKLVTPGKEHLEKHYADLAGKPFFPGLISCTTCPAKPRIHT